MSRFLAQNGWCQKSHRPEIGLIDSGFSWCAVYLVILPVENPPSDSLASWDGSTIGREGGSGRVEIGSIFSLRINLDLPAKEFWEWHSIARPGYLWHTAWPSFQVP